MPAKRQTDSVGARRRSVQRKAKPKFARGGAGAKTKSSDGCIGRQLALGIDRKRADEALRESEEHLRAIINQSNAGIASCDLNGRVLFVNQKLGEMLG
jgi:PAS domain-containing protein